MTEYPYDVVENEKVKMKYTVNIGYYHFGFDDETKAVYFAKLAKKHALPRRNDEDVEVSIDLEMIENETKQEEQEEN